MLLLERACDHAWSIATGLNDSHKLRVHMQATAAVRTSLGLLARTEKNVLAALDRPARDGNLDGGVLRCVEQARDVALADPTLVPARLDLLDANIAAALSVATARLELEALERTRGHDDLGRASTNHRFSRAALWGVNWRNSVLTSPLLDCEYARFVFGRRFMIVKRPKHPDLASGRGAGRSFQKR